MCIETRIPSLYSFKVSTRGLPKFNFYIKSEDNRLNYKIHKKNFRRIQRRNIFIYERNKSKNIEHLFEINNKEDFWKAFYSFKNKFKNDPYSDSQSSRLFDHFTKHA